MTSIPELAESLAVDHRWAIYASWRRDCACYSAIRSCDLISATFGNIRTTGGVGVEYIGVVEQQMPYYFTIVS